MLVNHCQATQVHNNLSSQAFQALNLSKSTAYDVYLDNERIAENFTTKETAGSINKL
jgi:hypothetical protein